MTDKLIAVLIGVAWALLLAAVICEKPRQHPLPFLTSDEFAQAPMRLVSRGPEAVGRLRPSGLRLTWRWEGCYVTATGCASWTDCDWSDADWVCAA